MDKVRKLYVLDDTEVSQVMAGLVLLEGKYLNNNDDVNALFCKGLYDKIDKCFELGVVYNEIR